MSDKKTLKQYLADYDCCPHCNGTSGIDVTIKTDRVNKLHITWGGFTSPVGGGVETQLVIKVCSDCKQEIPDK